MGMDNYLISFAFNNFAAAFCDMIFPPVVTSAKDTDYWRWKVYNDSFCRLVHFATKRIKGIVIIQSNRGCKMLRVKATHCWSFFPPSFFFLSLLVYGVWSLLTLMCVFFFYKFDKRDTNTGRTRWFYFWSVVDDLICKYDCLRGLLYWETLSSHASLSSKGFEVFDHSKMPVMFSSSEILEETVSEESSAL